VRWVVESYLLFLAALMLVGGTLGDRQDNGKGGAECYHARKQ